jgi:hypothetical protein
MKNKKKPDNTTGYRNCEATGILKYYWQDCKWYSHTRDVAQATEYLLSKYEVLGSNSNTAQKKGIATLEKSGSFTYTYHTT